MKSFLTQIAFIFLSSHLFSQVNDSIENKSLTKWNSESTVKTIHMIDFEFIEFEPNIGALGYNYCSKISQRSYIGFRIGVWYRGAKDDLPEINQSKSLNFAPSFRWNFRIWQSIELVSLVGVNSTISWPASSNSNVETSYFKSAYPAITIAPSITFYKKVSLRIGINSIYDFQSNNFINGAIWALGYNI
jgi:hypothetical protein